MINIIPITISATGTYQGKLRKNKTPNENKVVVNKTGKTNLRVNSPIPLYPILFMTLTIVYIWNGNDDGPSV